MKIKKMSNINESEINLRKFNIYIGISLGNKWFNEENLREYLGWALNHTKEKVLFLIADKIQVINYDVRDKDKTHERNLQKALEKGKEIRFLIKNLIEELPKVDRSRVDVLNWIDYEKTDPFYKKYTPLIYYEFNHNREFKERILELIKNMIKDRPFSDNDYLSLSKYFLEEFITLYNGITYNLTYYQLYIYPQETQVSDFIRDIQKGKTFQQLNKKLPKEKLSLAVVN